MWNKEEIRKDAEDIYANFCNFAATPESKAKIIEMIVAAIERGEERVFHNYSSDTGRVAGVIYRDGKSLVSTVTVLHPSFDAKNGSYVEILMRVANTSENECIY